MDVDEFLEEKLREQKLLSPDQLEGFKENTSAENSLANLLIEGGVVDPEIVLQTLSDYYGLPYVNLDYYEIDNSLLDIVPLKMAMQNMIFPLFQIRNTLMLAMADPSDIHLLDQIRIESTMGVEPVITVPCAIKKAVDRRTKVDDKVSDVIGAISDEDIGITQTKEDIEAEQIAEDTLADEPIVKLVNIFFAQAVRQKASDIHISPEEKGLRVRFRVDGILREVASPPKKYQPAIISRIKVLANLDIAEKRKPQDGRIKLKLDNQAIDIRVSTFPTVNGENVVMRILDCSNLLLDMQEIGLMPDTMKIFSSMIRKPYGIILVTGPTGSGKTTTLYTALQTVNSVDKNIITLEDPVEYNLELIRQGQVNPKAEFTFATGLRAILRQDPDIIMVGEIRDGETAQIAVEAALTGHLVFSTLHTNDAVGAIVRLADMGIEHFLISSSLMGVMAQRLVRKICQKCKEAYVPPPESLEEIGLRAVDVTFYHGVGCQDCFQTGYKGRIGIYELLTITPSISNAILKNAGAIEIKEIAIKEGIRFLRDDGIEKVKMGLTTIEEVLRVTKEGA